MSSFAKTASKSHAPNKWSTLSPDGLWASGLNEVENNREEEDGTLANSEWKVSKCGRLLDDVPLLGLDGRVWDLDAKPVVSLKPKATPILKAFCSRFLVVGGVAVFVGAGIGMCFTGSSWVVVMVRKAFTRTATPFIACKKFCGSAFKQGWEEGVITSSLDKANSLNLGVSLIISFLQRSTGLPIMWSIRNQHWMRHSSPKLTGSWTSLFLWGRVGRGNLGPYMYCMTLLVRASAVLLQWLIIALWWRHDVQSSCRVFHIDGVGKWWQLAYNHTSSKTLISFSHKSSARPPVLFGGDKSMSLIIIKDLSKVSHVSGDILASEAMAWIACSTLIHNETCKARLPSSRRTKRLRKCWKISFAYLSGAFSNGSGMPFLGFVSIDNQSK